MIPLEDATVVRKQDTLGGRPLFRGTRVPVETLFEHLADGMSLDEVLDEFPSISREAALAALAQACDLLKANAPLMANDDPTWWAKPRASAS